MRTLSEIRDLFVGARNLAKEASPAKVQEAAKKLKGISDHCKDLYSISSTYIERAKCRNIYESIDNVIEILGAYGFCNETVGAFFGLTSGAGASFSDISSGKGTILKSEIPAMLSSDGKDAAKDTSAKAAPAVAPVAPPAPPAVSMPMPVANAPKVAEPPKAQAPARAASQPTGRIPVASEDNMAPQSLDDFIGQEHVVRRLKDEIAAARALGKQHIDHILFFGNRGLGKSTLMKLIAKELGVRFEFLDCTSFMNDVNSQRMFNEFMVRISQLEEPVVIAFDEIHALPTRIQSNLLTLLNDRVYNYMTKSGEAKSVPIKNFTFIGATTDYDSVLSTLKDRCKNLTFFLKDYTRDELTKIFVNKFAAMGMHTTPDVLFACVNRCRSSIRDVCAIIKGIHTKAVLAKTDVVTLDMAEAYFTERDMDAIGLMETERKLLRVILEDPRGSVSEETLAARLYLDPAILTKEYEPYLMKIGFLSISNRGRTLTQKAEDYMRFGYFDFGGGITIGEKPDPDGSMKVSAPAPKAAPAPAVEVPAPAVEIPDPVAAAPAPAVEIPDPVAAAPAPAVEIPDPVAAAPAPAVEIPDPVAAAPAPAVEIPDPVAVAPAPAVEIPDPVAVAPAPAVEIPVPVAAAPAPAVEIPDPVAAAPAPAVEIPDPVAAAPAPAVEIPDPVAAAPAPAVEIPDPVAAAPAPAVEIPDPVAVTPAASDEAPNGNSQPPLPPPLF